MFRLLIILFLLVPFICLGQYSVAFDGDDYAKEAVAAYRSTDMKGAICGWFYVTDSSATGRIISTADEGSNTRYMSVSNVAGKMYYAHRFNDTAKALTTSAITNRSATWIHFVVQSNGTKISIYVNGVKQTVTVTTGVNNGDWFGDAPTHRDNLTLGVEEKIALAGHLTGSIDEIAIFSDTLSATLITTIYNSGNSYDVSALPNLVGHFPISEGDGTTISDQSGTVVFDFAAATEDPAWSSTVFVPFLSEYLPDIPNTKLFLDYRYGVVNTKGDSISAWVNQANTTEIFRTTKGLYPLEAAGGTVFNGSSAYMGMAGHTGNISPGDTNLTIVVYYYQTSPNIGYLWRQYVNGDDSWAFYFAADDIYLTAETGNVATITSVTSGDALGNALNNTWVMATLEVTRTDTIRNTVNNKYYTGAVTSATFISGDLGSMTANLTLGTSGAGSDLWEGTVKYMWLIQRDITQWERDKIYNFCLTGSWSNTYRVDATLGSDVSHGLTLDSAWASIDNVNAAALTAGDSVLLKLGETWGDSLVVATDTLYIGTYGTGNKARLKYINANGKIDLTVSNCLYFTGWTWDYTLCPRDSTETVRANKNLQNTKGSYLGY